MFKNFKKNLSIIYNLGFTLVEVIVVISISTIIMLVLFNSIFSLYNSNSYTIAQSNEIDQARRGLQAWLSDAKEMTHADDGTFPVAVMEPHRFGFYSNIDSDDSVEYVEYVLSATTFYKYTYEASGYPPVYDLVSPARTEILSEYVQNIDQATSTFSYFDSSGTELTLPPTLLTDVRYVEIKIIVNIDPIKAPGEFLLKSGTTPRNLKDNL